VLTRLLILWLLSEQPLHGYRIKRILDDPALRFWFALDYGSVYAVLRTLEREGLVEQAALEQEGGRPPRRRYAITRAGRTALGELLREAWVDLPRSGEPVDLAVAARSELEDREVDDLLARRSRALRDRVRELSELRKSAPTQDLVTRHIALAEAELAWIHALSEPSDEGKEASMQHPTDVQLIASLVVRRDDGMILLIRYHDDDERWWLPGEDLEPYEHPDEAARRILASTFPSLGYREPTFDHVESFRGRRGWHVVFHYLVAAGGDGASAFPAEWFDPSELPRTMHGAWERDSVRKVLDHERARVTETERP
jgi:DNA-binding PadR family transcriptional regulator/ADP-ribose pyrophosphatase YjhB (NUDIX family)